MKDACARAIDVLEKEEHIEIIKKFKSNWTGYFRNSATVDQFGVLGHGNCWINNIMFKYKPGVSGVPFSNKCFLIAHFIYLILIISADIGHWRNSCNWLANSSLRTARFRYTWWTNFIITIRNDSKINRNTSANCTCTLILLNSSKLIKMRFFWFLYSNSNLFLVHTNSASLIFYFSQNS